MRDDGKGGKAAELNARFDEWVAARGGAPIFGPSARSMAASIGCLRNIDAARLTPKKFHFGPAPTTSVLCNSVCEIVTKKGDRVGS
jgi:hypothetical protein